MLRRAAARARRAAAHAAAPLVSPAAATRAVWTPSAAGASGAAAKAAAAAAAASGEPSFDVLRVSPGGAAPELLPGVRASALRLAPRDAPLFARTRFCAPPATLTWRGDALYVRLVRGRPRRAFALPPKPRARFR
jgi:hypothetical protein